MVRYSCYARPFVRVRWGVEWIPVLLCVFAEAWNGSCVWSLRDDPIIVQKYPFIWISRLIIPNVIFTWFPKDNPKSISIGVERLKHRLISSDTLLLFPKCFMKCEMEILKVVMMKRYDFVKFWLNFERLNWYWGRNSLCFSLLVLLSFVRRSQSGGLWVASRLLVRCCCWKLLLLGLMGGKGLLMSFR